jgi:hypothetical protein
MDNIQNCDSHKVIKLPAEVCSNTGYFETYILFHLHT